MVCMPPSTCSTWAVIQDDLSLNKKQAILEMSSTVPIRFRGWRWAFASFFSGVFNNPAASGVSVNEGAITLTLTEGAHSAAKDFAKPSMAPFTMPTCVWKGRPNCTATDEKRTILA